ncbi:MAG: hypothetical protein HRF43_01440 [Phycisphaerae bacterium]|jgi:uncharacterized paraquat-inducible protein A
MLEPSPRSKPITLICPNLRCRSLLQVPESVRGQKVRCGKCGKNLIVPTNASGNTAPTPTTK